MAPLLNNKSRKMVENKLVSAPNMMEPALQEIRPGYVAGKLKKEKMDIGIVMSATDKDLIKFGIRTIGQRVSLRDICRRRYYDITNNSTHGCGSYSYNTTTKPNRTLSMQTLGREERSFLFSPRSW